MTVRIAILFLYQKLVNVDKKNEINIKIRYSSIELVWKDDLIDTVRFH